LSAVRGACAALIVVALGCSSPTTPSQVPTPTPPATSPTALSLTCPASVTATASAATGATVTFPAALAAGGSAPVQTACTPASGSLFPVGATTVRCTATDAAQATSACTFSVTVNPPPPQLSRTRFLAFGDSMTAGEITQPTGTLAESGFPNLRLVVVPSASYPTQLQNQLRARYTTQAAQITVSNAGRPGEWAEDGAVRLPAVLSVERPEVVLLLEGINELAALGEPGVLRAARAIDTMAKEARNRGARLFLATVPPTRSSAVNAVPIARVQALNTWIRNIARGEGAILVEVYEAIALDVPRYLGPDGVHPNEAGYQRIADTFFQAIRAELEVRR
jgi:lysophospholipase L1-like esterase